MFAGILNRYHLYIRANIGFNADAKHVLSPVVLLIREKELVL